MTSQDDPDHSDSGPADTEPGGITCSEAAERLYEYLDQELDADSAQAVREHLRFCEACYPRLAFEESFRELMRRVEGGQDASEHLRGRVLDALRREGFGEGGDP